VARMPRPAAEPGCVLVQVHYSFISAGTELAPLRSTLVAPDAPAAEKVQAYVNVSRNYISAAIRTPRAAARFALRLTREKLTRQATTVVQPTNSEPEKIEVNELGDQGWNRGYSVAGEVIAVGSGVTDFVPGDRVA